MKKGIFTAVFFLGILAGCASSEKKPSPPPKIQAGFAEVNGLNMYYEIHGNQEGTPLVLIHGGGSSIDVTYSKVLPFLSQSRKVIALDEQAHGRSGDRSGPVRFEQTADDVASLLKYLQVEKADVMGFSNGASSALQLTIRHPELVRKLVFVSSFTKKSGAQPQFWNFIKKADFSSMPQPLKDAFLKINPDPSKLRNMHDKDLARMQNFKDVPDKDVKSVKVPTLIVAGDQDVVRVEHVTEMSKMIQGSRILILPGGHGEFLGELVMAHGESSVPQWTTGFITEFLGAP